MRMNGDAPIWRSLLEPQGSLWYLTEESDGTVDIGIWMARHGRMKVEYGFYEYKINSFIFLRNPSKKKRNLNIYFKIGQNSQILGNAGFMLFSTYKQYVTSCTYFTVDRSSSDSVPDMQP